ncbi:MAG: hypothetical protein LBL06_02520, partial [Treponema sp.]|nr:hypothetical protein [Treponema sp.]
CGHINLIYDIFASCVVKITVFHCSSKLKNHCILFFFLFQDTPACLTTSYGVLLERVYRCPRLDGYACFASGTCSLLGNPHARRSKTL